MLGWVLGLRAIRRRLVFALKQQYYRDLELSIPLGSGLNCPLTFPAAWSSFAEIFVNGEYRAALEKMPPPVRWIDLGCHAGYFSLYLLWLRRQSGNTTAVEALLVDGDSRLRPAIERLIEINGVTRDFRSVHGLISRRAGEQQFIERPYMLSSLADVPLEQGGDAKVVAVLSAEDLDALLPPPYDLVKVDIEGGEYDFLVAYGLLLKNTRHLLIEWHPWQTGGGGKEQIVELADTANFHVLFDSSAGDMQADLSGGIILLKRNGA